ncbi:hypothetical protein ON010_g650 [Phytophthora cinnamomi]|nr:hypothetical protein ON010_g650 [Phytophthora cinnamomi]
MTSEAKKEVMYIRCSTLADATAATQAYERTHFSGDRVRSVSLHASRGSEGSPTPMDLSAAILTSALVTSAICTSTARKVGIELPAARVEMVKEAEPVTTPSHGTGKCGGFLSLGAMLST